MGVDDMTCPGEGLSNVKLQWLCFPSSRISLLNTVSYDTLNSCDGN